MPLPFVIIGILALVGILSIGAIRGSANVDEQGSLSPVVNPGPVSAAPKGGPAMYDDLIAKWAAQFSADPVLVKAIIAKESNFDPFATNPEKSGVSAARLRNDLLQAADGGDSVLQSYVVNPSLGLMQVRVSTARQYLTLVPVDLYDPETNLRGGVSFLAELIAKGIDLSSIDAYNVGFDGYTNRGYRNAGYQAAVSANYSKFQNDFS